MNEDKLKNLDESERTKFLIQFFNQANTAVASDFVIIKKMYLLILRKGLKKLMIK